MNSRIAFIRKDKGYNQDAFAEKLGLTKNFISLVENGKREPSDRTLKDICREFNVNEHWLRTGEGEIYVPRSQSQIITDFLGDVITDDDSFKKRLVEGLAMFEPEDWDDLEKLLTKFLAKKG